MNHPEIKSLYKYTVSTQRALNMVENQEVWFSTMSQFNDPFEGIYYIADDISHEAIISLAIKSLSEEGRSWSGISSHIADNIMKDDFGGLQIKEEVKTKIRASIQEMIETTKNSGILSLAEDSNNILMWSHYANEHKGICVELGRNIDEDTGNDKRCRPVKYSKEYPQPSIEDVLKGDHALTDKVAYTKSVDWAYEKEWRVRRDRGDCLHPLPGPVKSIILGAKWEGNLVEMQEFCVVNNISLLVASIRKGEFSLSFEDVTHKHI